MTLLKTYHKYLVKSYLVLLLQITLIFSSLIFILNIFEEINFFKDNNIFFYLPIALTFLNVPTILYDIFPFIFLIATQAFFLRLNERDEISIFKYSGLTNIKILSILAFVSFLIGIFIITVFYSFSAKLKHVHLNIKNEYAKDNKYLAVITENGLWIKDEISNNINMINAENIDDNMLKNVSITQFDINFNFLKRIDSPEAVIETNEWVLKNAKVSRDTIGSENIDSLKFATNFNYNKIISLFSNLSSLTIWELNKLEKDNRQLGYSNLNIKIHKQRILSFPLFLMIMTVFSGIIMLNIKKNKSLVFNIILGIFLSVVLYYITYFFNLLGENNKVPIEVAIWMPLLMLILCSSIGLVRINEK